MKGILDVTDIAIVLLACTLIVLVADIVVPVFFG